MNDLSTSTQATIQSTIDTHLDAYGESDASRRLALIQEVWAPDGHLFDPPIDGAGHNGIDDMLAAVQGQFPGHTFRRSTGIDTHHGIARYGWEMISSEGTVSLAGMDVAVVGADGKLTRIAGFFGDLPPRDA
jgi:hypothetical protein